MQFVQSEDLVVQGTKEKFENYIKSINTFK